MNLRKHYKKRYGAVEGMVFVKREKLYKLFWYLSDLLKQIKCEQYDVEYFKKKVKESMREGGLALFHLLDQQSAQRNLKRLHKEANRIKTIITLHQQRLIDYTIKTKNTHPLKELRAMKLFTEEAQDEFCNQLKLFWRHVF